MSMVGFPLLLIPLAICNMIVFLMPGVLFAAPLFTLTLMSGIAWTVTLADLLLALGIVLLLFEVMKGARPGGKYFTDHFLSLLVFAGAAAEFVMLPQFGNSTFFLLSLLSLVDFLSGISLRVRRPKRAAVVTAAAPVEPQPRIEPVTRDEVVTQESAAPIPAAPVVVETPAPASVEPIVPHDAAVTEPERSPTVTSPGLQPGSTVHPSTDTPPRKID